MAAWPTSSTAGTVVTTTMARPAPSARTSQPGAPAAADEVLGDAEEHEERDADAGAVGSTAPGQHEAEQRHDREAQPVDRAPCAAAAGRAPW